MSEQSTDDLRLRATEAQMRRALGLDNSLAARAQTAHPIPPSGSLTHRRHFVRDGEVPVTVVHHDDPGGTNKLEATRQALREQIEARGQIEQQLAEAQATIQALETQLAHQRIAKEEALSRAELQRQEVAHQLEDERAVRQRAEQARDRAIAGRQEAEDRLRDVMAAQEARDPSRGPERTKRSRKAGSPIVAGNGNRNVPAVAEVVGAKDTGTAKKQRGRPAKAHDTDSEFVEWWKPGWRDQFR